jgi:glyoxylase-like metal-dependent hydrolase (beta-lactamase superfamily II)
MAKYTIQPVSTGSFAEAETSLLYYLADDRNAGVKIPAVYWMFVVRGEGALVVVDTGPGEPAAWKQFHHNYDRTPDEEPLAALKRIGIEAEDVDVVINTHLHWDHCHANHLFPNAVVKVQSREIIEAMNPVPAHRGFYTPLNADPPWTRVVNKTVPVKGDAEIIPGIHVLAMPSHTVGFQSVLVDTAAGPILIAGDMLPYFDNWTGRWGFRHIPSGIFEAGLHEYYACFDRIEQIAPVLVLPGVDPRVAEHDVYGARPVPFSHAAPF